MAAIIQYRPAYFSGFENVKEEFSSLEELLNIDWISRFKFLPNKKQHPSFYQFSINKHSEREGFEYALIAEYNKGRKWLVVGYVDENDIIKELPVWQLKSKAKKNSKLIKTLYCLIQTVFH